VDRYLLKNLIKNFLLNSKYKMPLLRNMPQLRVPRYGGDETTKLLTKDGDCTLLGRKVHRPRNKIICNLLDNKTPFSRPWIKKSNTLQNGQDIGGGKKFASPGLAKSYAETLSNCVGFTHNTNTNWYWFHYNIANIINKQNCQKKRNWQWCDLYVRAPMDIDNSVIINEQPEITSKYLTGERAVDVADEENEDEENEEEENEEEENEDDAIPVPENELFDVCSHLEPNSCFKNCWNFLKVCADVCDNFSDDLIDNQLIC